MKFFLRSLAVGIALMLSLLAVRATPTLVGEFALNGDLSNNVAGGPALALLPFSSVSGSVTAGGYVFAANQGLTFTSPALTPADFSIELSFQFDATSGWRKIVDFANLGPDSGLYNLNGNLQVYPQSAAGVTDFSPGTRVDVVLTRDGATGLVTGYVNGVQRLSFNDSATNYALVTAASNQLTFFVDDHATGQNEASGGTLYYARIYNGALTSAEVAALYAAGAPSPIPEPAATAALLASGVLGGFFRRWHRRRG